jgi:hypothetical protein
MRVSSRCRSTGTGGARVASRFVASRGIGSRVTGSRNVASIASQSGRGGGADERRPSDKVWWGGELDESHCVEEVLRDTRPATSPSAPPGAVLGVRVASITRGPIVLATKVGLSQR